MTVQKKPQTPSEYWDYVRERDAEIATQQGDPTVGLTAAADL
jgi:hypothetical protein